MSRRDIGSEGESGDLNSVDDVFLAEWDAKGHPSEATVHAWIDRALSKSGAAQVEAHVNSCAQCADLVADARGLIAATSRVVTALDAMPRGVHSRQEVSDAASRIIALANTRVDYTGGRVPMPRPWYARRVTQIAAGMVAMVGGATWVSVRSNEADTVARAAAAAAASNQSAAEAKQDTVASRSASLVAAKPATQTAERARERDALPNREVVFQAERSARHETELPRQLARKSELPTDKPVAKGPDSSVVTSEVKAIPKVMGRRIASAADDTTANERIAPTRTISGIVVDAETGRPVEGVSVVVRGTNKSGQSDGAGRFAISDVPRNADSLFVRRIGYVAANSVIDSTSAAESVSVEVKIKASAALLTGVEVTSISEPRNLAKSNTEFTDVCLRPLVNQSVNTNPLSRTRVTDGDVLGNYQLVVADWPVLRKSTSITLKVQPDSSLRGSASSNGSRLDAQLRLDGYQWVGTFRRRAQNADRVQRVSLIADTSVARCMRK